MKCYFIDGPWKGQLREAGGEVIYAPDDGGDGRGIITRRLRRYRRMEAYVRVDGELHPAYEVDAWWA